jgi:hypothetical protein
MAGQAGAATPPAEADPDLLARIWVRGRMVPPRYSQIWDTAQLTDIFRRHTQGKYPGTRGVHPGFTKADIKTTIGGEVGWVPAPGGKVQVWLHRLDIDFSITTLDVQISKEYFFGSCGYQVIKEHEDQHVEFHRRAWEKYKGMLRWELAKSLKVPLRDEPLATGSLEAAEEAIFSQVKVFLDGYQERCMDEAGREHARIDTEENYRKTWEPCERP